MKRVTVDGECKFLDWEFGIVCDGDVHVLMNVVGCVDVQQ